MRTEPFRWVLGWCAQNAMQKSASHLRLRGKESLLVDMALQIRVCAVRMRRFISIVQIHYSKCSSLLKTQSVHKNGATKCVFPPVYADGCWLQFCCLCRRVTLQYKCTKAQMQIWWMRRVSLSIPIHYHVRFGQSVNIDIVPWKGVDGIANMFCTFPMRQGVVTKAASAAVVCFI